MLIHARRTLALLALALLTLGTTATASSLTVSIVRTTMDQSQWDQMRAGMQEAMAMYEAEIEQFYSNFWMYVDVQEDAIHFHYYVPYYEYYQLHAFWQPVIDQINAELAAIGVRYEIHWDAEYPERFGQVVETFQNVTELGNYYAWHPGFSYFYAGFYPYVYFFNLGASGWAYVAGQPGNYFLYIFGRGWVWTPGDLDDLRDL